MICKLLRNPKPFQVGFTENVVIPRFSSFVRRKRERGGGEYSQRSTGRLFCPGKYHCRPTVLRAMYTYWVGANIKTIYNFVSLIHIHLAGRSVTETMSSVNTSDLDPCRKLTVVFGIGRFICCIKMEIYSEENVTHL